MPTPSPISMPSMGAKSATVMAWPSSTMAMYAVPQPTSAVAMGSSMAAKDPKATSRTTAATATPMISLRCAPALSVLPTACPPSSTCKSPLCAALAVSTRAWACATGTLSASWA